MSPRQHEDDDSPWPRFVLVDLVDLGDTEDFERYGPRGFHPVHLGDVYGDERYRVVHKLGAGGFSTVWLACDGTEHRWVALKIVIAEHSTSVYSKSQLSRHAALQCAGDEEFVVEHPHFTLDGPNGRHLCLVLPVLGPSTSQLSAGFSSRIRPWLSRRASYQATRALAKMHTQGLCHGDVTTANILFGLLDFDRYTESDIYRLFGKPEMTLLETYSGERPGPGAPSYIVKPLDFLSSKESIISKDVRLIDFDQSFPVSSPPERMLGTPVEFLAPEVAVGLKASPRSDVWALGCSIFRLRSGESPFSGYEVTSPADLMKIIIQTLGDMPSSWEDILFDYDGQPTKEPTKGEPLEKWEGKRPIKDLVFKIRDQPENSVVDTGSVRPEHQVWGEDENKPYPQCFSDTVWKPTATEIDNTYLYGYDDETDALLEAMPKISENEAALLYDLLSKIFVYDPQKRLSAREMLSHPWFHMDGLLLKECT
ncbi:Uncharacterized protein BP5553_02149 [Venustampulla echinocandica]|uniref:EKC/KEOPS complex subunit BUD32 n=1 Tax=Venustampulla echinocandica TaxID=2656787 RepID=A0A370U315_9HELO|nr:Uncharacterized protein BP5553_02149 [Venustampulla echinocandica]RDL42170.1 Uncharacterized protein BP5553_02149 [Venustampulla echinocandica]